MHNDSSLSLAPPDMKTEEAIALAIARRSEQGFYSSRISQIEPEEVWRMDYSDDILSETLAVAGLEDELIDFDTDSLQYGRIAWLCPIVLTRFQMIGEAPRDRLEELAKTCIRKDPKLAGAEFQKVVGGNTKDLAFILKTWANAAAANFINHSPMRKNIQGLIDTATSDKFALGCTTIEQLYERLANASYEAGFIAPEVIETVLLRTTGILDLDTCNLARNLEYEDLAGAQLALFLAVIAVRHGIEFPDTDLDAAKQAKITDTLAGRANAIDSGSSKGGEFVVPDAPENAVLSPVAITAMASALAGSISNGDFFQGVVDLCELINPPEEVLSDAELEMFEKGALAFVSSGAQSESAVRESLSEHLMPYFYHRFGRNIEPIQVSPGRVKRLEKILTSALRERFPDAPAITSEDYFKVVSWRMDNLQ